MKAIMVMFDTLCRDFLPPYGNTWIHAPNFRRLAERSVTFDQAYVGSMPCMPARRELHTGRYNFMHRSWGPLEPFDESMPDILSRAGIHTHLVSDHYHYWEDGGATYHNRYSTWESFRGQEGDPWKGVVDPPLPPEHLGDFSSGHKAKLFRQDQINRRYMAREEQQSQARTFRSGIEFMETNSGADNWFLQIETFDPHEPHFVQKAYKDLYDDDYDGPLFDWPYPRRVEESEEACHHARTNYAALVSMCDRYLGTVLDAMDRLGLWDDTMLIVNTDHGYLLSEHGWWGKNIMPLYNEIAHIPLFIWDPRSGRTGVRSHALTQIIDMAPTLYGFFGVEPARYMQGMDLGPVLSGERDAAHDAVLFGAFGGQINCTDGRYVYMRGPASPDNEPLYQYTLMPTHMTGYFSPDSLQQAELVNGWNCTAGARLLRLREPAPVTPGSEELETRLFDLENDPRQENPIHDASLEERMITILVRKMKESDAPDEQFARLGLQEAE